MARYTITNRQSDIDFECDRYPVARTLQNCKNLLMCHMGEVPYDRLRGFNIRLLDMPIDVLNEALIEELDRVMAWEPDAEVVNGYAYLNSENETVIVCELEINLEEG